MALREIDSTWERSRWAARPEKTSEANVVFWTRKTRDAQSGLFHSLRGLLALSEDTVWLVQLSLGDFLVNRRCTCIGQQTAPLPPRKFSCPLAISVAHRILLLWLVLPKEDGVPWLSHLQFLSHLLFQRSRDSPFPHTKIGIENQRSASSVSRLHYQGAG